MSKTKKLNIFDEAPTDLQVLKFAMSFRECDVEANEENWKKDKSKDFYLGMFSAIRLIESGFRTMESNNSSLDVLRTEIAVLTGQLSEIIINK